MITADINKIKKELIKQKQSRFKGNIYHYSQVLTSNQTEVIFDTSAFIHKSDELIKLDDLI